MKYIICQILLGVVVCSATFGALEKELIQMAQMDAFYGRGFAERMEVFSKGFPSVEVDWTDAEKTGFKRFSFGAPTKLFGFTFDTKEWEPRDQRCLEFLISYPASYSRSKRRILGVIDPDGRAYTLFGEDLSLDSCFEVPWPDRREKMDWSWFPYDGFVLKPNSRYIFWVYSEEPVSGDLYFYMRADNYVRIKSRAIGFSGLKFDPFLQVSIGSREAFLALEKAVKKQDQKGAIEALERGADPNGRSLSGLSPLNLAAKQENPDMIRLLVQRGAVLSKEGGHSLYLAATSGCNENIHLLIELGVDVNEAVNFLDNKDTPLLAAVRADGDLVDTVKLLVDLGADLEAVDLEGKSAVELAREGSKVGRYLRSM